MRAAWLKAAEFAGSAVRGIRASWPGVLGASSITVGLALIYVPLAFLAAGAFLLILDNRRP